MFTYAIIARNTRTGEESRLVTGLSADQTAEMLNPFHLNWILWDEDEDPTEWELFPEEEDEEEDIVFDEDFEDFDDDSLEMGFDPYEGCYTYDC